MTTSTYGYDSNSNRTFANTSGAGLISNDAINSFNLGNSHNCVITPQGVKCWGNGASGYLGLGNTNSWGYSQNLSALPVVNVGGSVKALSNAVTNSCAVLLNGDVRCWGLNHYGQLGLGNITTIGDTELPSTAPVLSLGGPVRLIAGGEHHNCVVKEDNNVVCWGRGISGQLGYGNGNNIGDDEYPSSAGNVSTGVTEQIKQISLGKQHTCILTVNGNVKCWGKNSTHQLGQSNVSNNIGDNEYPSTIPYLNFGQPVSYIATGGEHTCVVLQDKSLKCWGANSFGQLGLSNTTFTPFSGTSHPITDVGEDVVYVQAGDNNTCVITVTGKAKCWGKNDFGQLGQGNLTNIGDNELPSSIPFITLSGKPLAIDIAQKHACAILEGGNVQCWGDAINGVLGYGNTTDIGDDETPSSVGVIPFINTGSVAYDSQDRLLSYGSKAFTYNANGDLLTETNTQTSTTKNFTYDVFGNLKQVVLPSKTITYLVDAHNRRVAKKENGTAVAYYIWNTSDQLIGITDGSGALQARFIYGTKSHVPDYMTKNNTDYQIITNHLGSPVAVVDTSSGDVEQEIVWDEWGNVVSDSNPGFMPFGYAGCLYDLDTKLCRFGARDYDASIGRWLSKDPILFEGKDTNLYGYVLQDSINMIDPEGKTAFLLIPIIGIYFGTGDYLGGGDDYSPGYVVPWKDGSRLYDEWRKKQRLKKFINDPEKEKTPAGISPHSCEGA